MLCTFLLSNDGSNLRSSHLNAGMQPGKTYSVLLCIVLNELDNVIDLLERQSIVSSSSFAMNMDC